MQNQPQNSADQNPPSIPSEIPMDESLNRPDTRTKVLIVDDEVNLCQMLKDILEECDFETAYAEDGESALKQTQEFKPTVALIDFKLGNFTGIEVAHALRKIDEDLPVILMTAYPSLDLAVRVIQSDIYDFLLKPVDKTYLLRSIAKAAEKRKLSEENKKLIAFLKQSNIALDRMNRMKSKFLSIVTHDLRTPLTSIRGYSEILKTADNLSKEDEIRCFTTIDKSVKRMNYLISNLLDMVSIEAGKLRVVKSPMDFTIVCHELKETMAPIAASKNVTLQWELPSNPLMIMGDSNRLFQVVTNLVSNAFKHTPEKGKIVIRLSPDITKPSPPASPAGGQLSPKMGEGDERESSPLGEHAPRTTPHPVIANEVKQSRPLINSSEIATPSQARNDRAINDFPTNSPKEDEKTLLIEVIDNGGGISPENQSRIFEQFFQIESSPTRREGLGLGLAISKEIIHSHQGEIGVFSEGLGKGSKFWFTLPLLSQ